MVWSCTSRDSQESSLMFKSISSSVLSLLYDPTLTSTCDYWKNHSFDYIWTFVSKVMSLLFNTLSRFVIAFLPRSKQMSFSFMAAVIICRDFGAQGNKVLHCFHCFCIYFPWSDGTECHDLFFECWVFSQFFHSPLSPSSREEELKPP